MKTTNVKVTLLANGSLMAEGSIMVMKKELKLKTPHTIFQFLVPCCFDKDAKHSLGDSKETSFRQILKFHLLKISGKG